MNNIYIIKLNKSGKSWIALVSEAGKNSECNFLNGNKNARFIIIFFFNMSILKPIAHTGKF